jgi:pimeloyl-ACP methyl ester carboxylesterase
MMLRTDREPTTTEHVMRAHLAAIRAWAKEPDRAESLKRVRQPVLVVNGNHDIMIPPVNSYSLAQQLPNAELVLYPDAGHGSIFQYAERFASDVAKFVSDSTP